MLFFPIQTQSIKYLPPPCLYTGCSALEMKQTQQHVGCYISRMDIRFTIEPAINQKGKRREPVWCCCCFDVAFRIASARCKQKLNLDCYVDRCVLVFARQMLVYISRWCQCCVTCKTFLWWKEGIQIFIIVVDIRSLFCQKFEVYIFQSIVYSLNCKVTFY